MFLPPHHRQPRLPPPEPPPKPKPRLTRREETVVLGAIGVVAVLLVLAPIGGSTLIQALWYAVRH